MEFIINEDSDDGDKKEMGRKIFKLYMMGPEKLKRKINKTKTPPYKFLNGG